MKISQASESELGGGKNMRNKIEMVRTCEGEIHKCLNTAT